MAFRRRDLVPFLVGFACALLLSSIKLSLFHLGGMNGLDHTADTALWTVEGSKGKSGTHLTASREFHPSTTRKKVLAVIGVQTGFTTDHGSEKYDYDLRRQALRRSWFPPTQAALDDFEARTGIVLRFVIGHSPDAEAEAGIASEEKKYGAFLRLPIEEAYLSLANKTLTFFRTVAEQYDAEYIIKADDDVYLRLDRVPPIIKQWKARNADYIGCMKNGDIYTSPKYRWYEPQHAVLGSKTYFTHCWGTVYVLSGHAVEAIASIEPSMLRFFANEDVTVGSWMLALKMQHYDDRRLCSPVCDDWSLAVYDIPECAGLCNPAKRLKELHESKACHTPATQPDGTVPMVISAIDFSE